MEFYQEIKLLPTMEFSVNILWSKIYEQLHIKLAELQNNEKDGDVGIAFPEYCNSEEKTGLGHSMRIFAPTREYLENLDVANTLRRYRDYFAANPIHKINAKKIRGYAVYSRFRFENSRSQKAKRYAKRHNISYQEALALFPLDRCGKEPPYIQFKSLSNGNKFRLYVVKKLVDSPRDGGFSAYGLSDTATVPEFLTDNSF